jgi:hypothetical protein
VPPLRGGIGAGYAVSINIPPLRGEDAVGAYTGVTCTVPEPVEGRCLSLSKAQFTIHNLISGA